MCTCNKMIVQALKVNGNVNSWENAFRQTCLMNKHKWKILIEFSFCKKMWKNNPLQIYLHLFIRYKNMKLFCYTCIELQDCLFVMSINPCCIGLFIRQYLFETCLDSVCGFKWHNVLVCLCIWGILKVCFSITLYTCTLFNDLTCITTCTLYCW